MESGRQERRGRGEEERWRLEGKRKSMEVRSGGHVREGGEDMELLVEEFAGKRYRHPSSRDNLSAALLNQCYSFRSSE